MAYPSSPESFTTKLDGPGNTIAAAHMNAVQSALEAITTAMLSSGLAHALLPDATANARALGSASQRFGQAYVKGMTLGTTTELTIAAGVVTATPGCFTIDTESNAASDDLDTITAGSGVAEGSFLYLHAENVARVVTLKDGSGNLLLAGDYALSATDRTILLRYDGTNWREVARSVNTSVTDPVRILDRDVVVNDVNTTTTETTIYTYSVAGGTLGSTKALRLSMLADILNNIGGADNLTLRVKYGATTIFAAVLAAGSTAARRGVSLSLTLSALNATNAQIAQGIVLMDSAAGGVTGTAGDATPKIGTHAGVAEDSTAAKTLAVTVEWASSSASASFRCHAVQLELLD